MRRLAPALSEWTNKGSVLDEPQPEVTVGMLIRADAPLAPAAQAMARAMTAVAGRLADTASWSKRAIDNAPSGRTT